MVIFFVMILFVSAASADQIDSTETPDLPAKVHSSAPADSVSAPTEPAAIDGAETDSVAAKPHSPSGAMWRSVLFPGWGQLYNRRYLKAVIIGGGEISLILGAWLQDQRYEKAKKDNDSIAADFYKNDRNKFYWWIAGTVIYSMADAYADGHLYDFELDRNLSAGIDPGWIYIRINF